MPDAHKKSIVLYCNYVTGGWSPLERASLNGSEETIVQVAEAWARAGHQVQVYQNGFLGECNSVQYRARKDVLPDKPDLLVTFKTLEHIDHPAGAKIFWTADLPGGSPAVFLPPKTTPQIDAIVCISTWHRDLILNACPWIPPEKVKALWLGIDPAETVTGPKIPGRCVYASSLDRGLHPLLDMWPEIKKRAPEAELHVLYGWDFWLRSEAVVPEEVRQSMIKERREIEKLLKQPGVTYLGRTSREVYCQEMGQAIAWLYPCTGGEVCCKVALEAQASGVIPVAWPTMALIETVLSPKFHAPSGDGGAFITQVLKVLKYSEPFREELRQVQGKIQSWQQMADQLWSWADQKLSFVPTPEPELFPGEVTRFEIPHRQQMPAHKLDIMMAVPGMPFVGDTDQKESLGGSETMGLQLARELAKRDHRVTMFCNLPLGAQPGKYDNVTYLPMNELGAYLGSYTVDAYIAQRDPMLINIGNRARITALWCHDLGLLRFHTPFRGALWNLDYIVPVSHWHGAQLRRIYGLGDPEVIVPMRNGIDLDVIKKTAGWVGKRDRNALVYASRPERGLDLLLDRIFPRLLERNPKLVLYVAGYNNTTEEMKPFYDYCFERIKQYGPRVRWMGYLKKPELYGLYSRAWAYLYPTKGFEEVSPLHGDTLIDTPGGRVSIEQLCREGRKDFLVYAFDIKKNQTVLAKVAWVKRTRKNAKMITLHFRHGRGRNASKTGSITLTPDHEVMLRNGTYRQARLIQPGDSVMPFNRRWGGGGYRLESGDRKRYALIGLNNEGNYQAEHRFVYEQTREEQLTRHDVVDHLDGDTQNNTPENLAKHRGHSGHKKAHWDRMSPEKHLLEGQKRAEGFRRYSAQFSPEELSEIKRRACLSRWEKLWQDPVRLARRNQAVSDSRRAHRLENHVITRVEVAKNADGYCMEVPGVHNFVANGIVVHNCLSAMECAACGLPFVASTRGALPETTDQCPGFSRLAPHPGEATEAFIEDYVEQAWEVISNEELNTQMSQAGRNGASAYSIAQVAADWEEFLLGAIEKRTRNLSQMFVAKFAQGDTYGAKQLLEEYPLEDPAPRLEELKGRVGLLEPDIPGKPPVNLLPYLMQCISGFSFQSVRGLGPEGEAVAHELATASGKPYVEGLADLLITFETIDCSPNPELHILDLESMVLPGGHVISAVAGPGRAQNQIFSAGLRHGYKGRWIFDNHDIRDLLGQKKDFMQFVFSGNLLSKYDTSPMSWLILRWQVGGKLPKIDWARRRDLSVPSHQTVSLCMIVKNAESLLLRCLKSVELHADEILIGDDGSTDSSMEIAQRFGATIFPIPSPLDIGFDGARNLTIGRATGEWIFWIDSDEELLEGEKLPKYFRQNAYLGYGVRQHHFSAVPESAFKPDLPVRFFRRTQWNKPTGIRFFGFVHEHPEIRINTSVGEQIVMSDVHLAHDGYLTESVRRSRFDRNLKLMFRDQQLYPDRKLGKFLMIRDWIHLSRNVMQQNGGQVTPDVVQYLEASIALFREEFLGAVHIMGIDGLQYYNEALNLLRRGYDVQIAMKIAGINGQAQDLNYAGRVASVEDLQKLLKVSTDQMTFPWTGEYI